MIINNYPERVLAERNRIYIDVYEIVGKRMDKNEIVRAIKESVGRCSEWDDALVDYEIGEFVQMGIQQVEL